MISLVTTLIILFGHWLSDFVWQPDWMGKGKSKDWMILTNHAGRITIGMTFTGLFVGWIAGLPAIAFGYIFLWALVQGVTHFAIDAVTSRCTGHFYAKGDHHNFFVVIGFDQFLHLAIAFATLGIFLAI